MLQKNKFKIGLNAYKSNKQNNDKSVLPDGKVFKIVLFD